MFGLRYLKNVSTLQLDRTRCNGCQMCTIVCPHHVFTMEAKKAKIIDRDLCMECGACALNCPENAIYVNVGVGCATAVLQSKIKGTEISCGCCGDNDQGVSCCG